MSRTARKISENGIYHVMISGINKQNIFECDYDKEKYLYILSDYKKKCGFELYGFCLMSNHIHLLIKTGEEPLGSIFQKTSTKYVYWYNTKYDRSGHLFQDRYKSEPVDDDGYFLTVLRYIHHNPIKGGLPGGIDYKYSSYRHYANEGTSKLIDTAFACSFFEKKGQLLAFLNEPNEGKCLECNSEKPLRLTDEAARDILYGIGNTANITEFQLLDEKTKQKSITQAHNNGASIRQLNRLTGISKSVIEYILRGGDDYLSSTRRKRRK